MKIKQNNNKFNIFRRGSVTYFYSSIFFPAEIRKKVFTLYAYVRTVDNFVDSVPQDKKNFQIFKKKTILGLNGIYANNKIIDDFIELSKECSFEDEWILSFINTMERDLNFSTYETYSDLKNEYIYGSASVIGLMMARILSLPKESYQFAMAQGEAMQMVNFIRDIREDLELKRIYIPQESFKRFKILDICPVTDEQKEKFKRMIRFEIKRYFKIQEKAEKGYKFIPKKYLVSIKTANDIYKWTAESIYDNPLLVLSKKIKPQPLSVMARYFKNYTSL